MVWLTLFGLQAVVIAVILFGIGVIRALCRKGGGKLTKISLIMFFGGLAAFFGSVCSSLYDFLMLMGMLFLVAVPIVLILLVVRLLLRKPLKKTGAVLGICILLSVAFFVGGVKLEEFKRQEAYKNHEMAEPIVQTEYNFEVKDGDEPLEVLGVHTIERLGYITVFDADKLHLVFEEENATAEDCRRLIRESATIPDHFKDFFCDFVDRIEIKYPDLNLEILHRNLKTLKVEELGSFAYLHKSLSSTSLGVYVTTENAIYIPKGTKYVEGEFGFQVIAHEFCHAARINWSEDTHQKATFYDDPDMSLLSECMNSVFSCSLLNYYEWDIAYQVPSNYLRIMLECMDNYELQDYMHHGDTWFLSKLDECTGHTNYAKVMWKLIALQRSDWESDRMDVDAKEYYPIYDYLCDMYYGKYITPEMSSEERKKVAHELVYKAFYDCPEGYKKEPQRFYDNLESFEKLHGFQQ